MLTKIALYVSLALIAGSTNSFAQSSNDVTRVPDDLLRKQGTTVVVTVTGYGATSSDARNDAIRQALQRTMQQLIVVDRVIKDDAIIRDKIMSTMNGYIEQFEELETKEEGQQVAIKAKVTVSSSRIENYIAKDAGGGGQVAGSALSAESERAIAQRKTRGEVFDRLFRGFPGKVIDVKVLSIKPSANDPSDFEFTKEIRFSPEWIRSLKSGLRGLTNNVISVPPNKISRIIKINNIRRVGQRAPPTQTPALPPRPAAGVRPRAPFNTYRAQADARRAEQIARANALQAERVAQAKVHAAARAAASTINEWVAKGGTSMCIDEESGGQCFLLPVGDYASSLQRIENPTLSLAIRFIDKYGRSVHATGECLVDNFSPIEMKISRPNFHSHGNLSSAGFKWLLNATPMVRSSVIKGEFIDMKAADQYAVYPFFSSNDRFSRPKASVGIGIADITLQETQNVCGGFLDDAVRRTMTMR